MSNSQGYLTGLATSACALLIGACSAPGPAPATPATPAPTAAVAPAAAAAAATIPPQPTAVLVATAPPTLGSAATAVAPTVAATIAAQPAPVANATPGPVLKAIGDLPAADGALAPIETRNEAQDPSVATPVELQLTFEQPIGAADTLRGLVESVQRMPGVSAVKSDGVHMIVQYDTARVQPPQIHQVIDGLGHSLAAGTDVQDAGSAAD